MKTTQNMKPEQWPQLAQLYHAALERAPAERAAFLDAACAADPTLRREVESLLQAHQQADGFLAEQVAGVAAEWAARQPTPSFIGHRISHYEILSLLGAGGMGEVYQARDHQLDRIVALKILPADVATNAERLRRFVREAKAASALNHPHVATIYEIGAASTEIGGIHFIAMEYVAGQTLAAKISGQPLAINELIEIGSQIADALDEAHRKGITHRDIKPANVMLNERGQVKVLDFGLAKFTPRADSESSTLVKTEPGVMMGTVAYMSPEQALGRDVDHRSDIFSLGVVLYEMATGQRPFRGATASETIDHILHSEPQAIAQFNEQVPTALAQIVSQCLAKERAQRYPSARELLTDLDQLKSGNLSVTRALPTDPVAQTPRTQTGKTAATSSMKGRARWLAVAVLVAVVLAAALVYWRMNRAPSSALPEIKSLAVLPLENLSGDPAQEYFAEGMTEALISNLSQVRALRVISRTSVLRFKGSRKPLAEIARELNVDAVIEGSVQRAGGRVKITARLIQAVNETLLRSFDYERELADVLKLQSEVARAVADEIRTQVTAEERARLASARRVNPEAHEAYLLGRYHLRRQNEADLKLAISYFERAIQLDASYAAAWAGLSLAWLQRGIWGATLFREVELPARQATVKALELDAGSAEGYASLAMLKHRYEWDWAGAEHDFRRAIELDPGSVEAHRFFAFLLTALGRHTEAINEMQTAEQLDPLSSLVQSDFGTDLNFARKYEQAERHLNRAIELDPLNHGAYSRLSRIYREMGRYADAIATLEKAKALQSDNRRSSIHIANFALVYARMGRREEALQMLNELQRTTDPARFPVSDAAAVWAALGNKDEAFRLLFDAVEERATLLIFTKVNPYFDSLHSDPRWKELLRRMNFPEG
jgi:serine/threonine protein kinase/Flp pilus assembly protein TadD